MTGRGDGRGDGFTVEGALRVRVKKEEGMGFVLRQREMETSILNTHPIGR